MINIVVTMDLNGAIGKNGKILCKLKDNVAYFDELTKDNVVVMGRKTFENIEYPLHDKTCVVLTKEHDESLIDIDGLIVLESIEELRFLNALNDPQDDLFVIGGSQLFEQTLPFADRIYLSRIYHRFEEADSFFPDINLYDWKAKGMKSYKANEHNDYDFTISLLERY